MLYLLVACTFVAALYAVARAQGANPADSIWFGCGSIALFLSLIAAIEFGLHRRRRRRNMRLEKRGLQGRLESPGYFRIHPYEDNENDRRQFARADDAHQEVLNWLRCSDDSVLYLTGRSGTGKSSLLAACVVPTLREVSRWTPIVIRTWDDPLLTLRQELLKLGDVETNTTEAVAEVYDLLASAAQQVPGKLLVLCDQFEEFLILQSRGSERLQAWQELLAALEKTSIEGLVVLIVMRSDYLGLLQEQRLPPMRPNVNWKEVSAFRIGDAHDFLLNSGLRIGTSLLDDIVNQLARAETTKGLIRPITLNMVGLMLARRATATSPRVVEIDEFLSEYVNDSVGHADIKPYAPVVLSRLITPVGTTRARDVGAMAAETGIREPVLTGCLLGLAHQGLVRRIDQRDNVWEVSHDYIAHLLHNNLRRSQSWHEQPWLRRTVLALCCCLLGLLGWFPFQALTDAPSQRKRNFESADSVADTNAEVGGPRALLIGCSDYSSFGKPLRGSDNDVAMIRRLLIRDYGFAAEEIVVLDDGADAAKHPTRQNIQRECERLITNTRSGLQYVIFLAGNGSSVPSADLDTAEAEPSREAAFFPTDVEPYDVTTQVYPNAIRSSEFLDWIRPALDRQIHLCVICDAIGGFGLGHPAKSEKRTMKASNSVFLGGSQPGLKSVELMLPTSTGEKTHGLFTYTLAKTLTASTEEMTYAQLVQRIHDQYIAAGRSFPTPWLGPLLRPGVNNDGTRREISKADAGEFVSRKLSWRVLPDLEPGR